MKSKRVVFALIIFLLTACNSEQASTIIPTPVEFATNATTITASIPTSTFIPTKTPSPTIQPTETISIEIMNAVSTLDAVRIDLFNQFPKLKDYGTFCSLSYCHGMELSPNGQLVYVTNGNTIDLFNISNQRIGKYSFYDIYGFTIGSGSGSVEGIHWSSDERYLYISATINGDGGPVPYYNYTNALVRVNLENGTWKDAGISGSLKFSPNDKYIVYSNYENQLRVRDFKTGEEQIYFAPDDFLYFGEYVWSFDSKKVVFIGVPDNWSDRNSRFALFLIDIEGKELIQVYESETEHYYPIDWVESNKVILKEENESGEWLLDLSVSPPTINP